MDNNKKIFAQFDNTGIYVYQAFNDEIANEALQLKKFGKKFYLDRLSWIKCSFGWILYRSHYASNPAQNRILKIKISHEGFLCILAQAIPTIQDMALFRSGKEWRERLNFSEVRYQWDPDRDCQLKKLQRRALQLGLCKKTLESYSKKWLQEIEDITPLVHRIKKLASTNPKKILPLWPNEKEYPIPEKIKIILGTTKK